MRYTEYHAGKAVIKDKNALSEAMEKLAKLEDEEESGGWIPCSERLPKYGVLCKIANYFTKEYEGDDDNAPTLNITISDIREICRMHQELSRERKLLKQGQMYGSQWIPCSERLPVEQTDVLVTVKYNGFIGMYGTQIKTGFLDEYGWNGDCFGGTVVAWMPLPEPYRGE